VCEREREREREIGLKGDEELLQQPTASKEAKGVCKVNGNTEMKKRLDMGRS
jgi:hypothetical protein